MRVIKLYDLDTVFEQIFPIPYGAQILHAELYDGKHLRMWAVVSEGAQNIYRKFWQYTTSDNIEDGALLYISTFKFKGKYFHLFMEADDGFKPLVSKLPVMDLSEHGGSSVKF